MAKRVFEIPDLPGSELLERAADVAGLELAVLADALDGSLDAYDSLDAVAVWGRVVSWAQARQAEAAATVEDHVTELYGPGDAVRPSPTSGGPGEDWSRTGVEPRASRELAMRLGIARPAAATLIKTGRAITGPMTATGEALAGGQLCWAKARAITGGLEGLPEPLVMDVEDALLPEAGGHTPAQLKRDVAKLVVAADPEGAAGRHQVARGGRRVNRPSPLPDGMARLSAVLPAEDALALDLSLDGAARHARAESDGRTTDQLRADALATVGHHALATGRVELPALWAHADVVADEPSSGALPEPADDDGAEPAGDAAAQPADEAGTETRAMGKAPFTFPTGSSAPRINVTVPLSALLGHELEQPGSAAPLPDAEPPGSQIPGSQVPRAELPGAEPPPSGASPPGEALRSPAAVPELHGYGAIDPLTARALSAGGIWRRLVSDPESGTVLDLGRKVRRPPADLARLVRARDGTCTRPGCTVTAGACELDHVQPWEHGGATSAANLTALCPSDHRAKSRGEFRVVRHASGAVDWTSPTGHTYRRTPGATVVHLARHDGGAEESAEAEPPY